MRPFITELRLEEPARFNPERLEDLCLLIGEARAETEVALALDRISAGVAALGRPDLEANHAALRDVLRALVRDAELIGMATLARVATHVLTCLEAGNTTALSATMARLKRVGERSIHAVWDLDDLSG